MKFLKALTALSLLVFFGFGCAGQPATQDNPQLAAYNKIKVGDSPEAVTAILDSLSKGDKNAVDKSAADTWQWSVVDSPKNWNDDVLPSPVTGSGTTISIAFKDGKVIALLYQYKTMTKSSVKTETPAGTETEITSKLSNNTSVDFRVNGDKAFLQVNGF